MRCSISWLDCSHECRWMSSNWGGLGGGGNKDIIKPTVCRQHAQPQTTIIDLRSWVPWCLISIYAHGYNLAKKSNILSSLDIHLTVHLELQVLIPQEFLQLLHLVGSYKCLSLWRLPPLEALCWRGSVAIRQFTSANSAEKVQQLSHNHRLPKSSARKLSPTPKQSSADPIYFSKVYIRSPSLD